MMSSSSNDAMRKAGVLLDLPFKSRCSVKDVKAPPDLPNSSNMVLSGIQSLLKKPLPVLPWISESASDPMRYVRLDLPDPEEQRWPQLFKQTLSIYK